VTDETKRGAEACDVPGAARLTPYEMVFGAQEFEERIFPAIRAEAEMHGEEPGRRERFAFLSVAGDTLRELVPPDAPPEIRDDYRAFLYHAFNFWRYGRCVYKLERAVVRYLVESRPGLDGWEFRLPKPSVYLQLPANLFWASISTDVPPEPVDGMFVTTVDNADPLGTVYGDLQVLMVLGIRRQRPGFSIIPFDTEVGDGIPAVWVDTPGREEGEDFANVLPGGEMAGLYSILTTAEALKLAARAVWYVDAHPDHVVLNRAPERRERDRPGSVPLSHLPFHRVRLGDEADAAPEDAGADA
jgi:hypothetical protein